MKDLDKVTIGKIKAGQTLTFEELNPLLRPQGVQNGVMKVGLAHMLGGVIAGLEHGVVASIHILAR